MNLKIKNSYKHTLILQDTFFSNCLFSHKYNIAKIILTQNQNQIIRDQKIWETEDQSMLRIDGFDFKRFKILNVGQIKSY